MYVIEEKENGKLIFDYFKYLSHKILTQCHMFFLQKQKAVIQFDKDKGRI